MSETQKYTCCVEAKGEKPARLMPRAYADYDRSGRITKTSFTLDINDEICWLLGQAKENENRLGFTIYFDDEPSFYKSGKEKPPGQVSISCFGSKPQNQQAKSIPTE